MNDINLQNLLNDLKNLVKNKQDNVNVSKNTNKNIKFEGFQAPVKGSYYNSGNYSPNFSTDRRHVNHKGTDIRSAGGTPIYPIAPGIITSVGSDPKGGNVVNIMHPQGVRSYYAHLGTVKVQKGDKVGFNTIIGTIGNSGNAKLYNSAPHLHIQVWKDNQLQDPGNFFYVPPYSKVDPSKEKVWLSEKAKLEANNFNMKAHKEKIATYNRFSDLIALAEIFDELNKC